MPKARISIDELQKQKGVRVTPYTRVIFIVLIAAALIGGMFAVAASIGKANQLPDTEQIKKTLSGKTIGEDRADAISAVASLLNSVNAPGTIAEAGDTIAQLEAEDFSGLDPNFADGILLYDTYANNSSFKSQIAMSIYSIAALSKQANGGEIVADGALSGQVRVDQENGIAQVPIDIFTGGSSPVSFQMIYTDGAWKLEPHSFTTYIVLSANRTATSTDG